MTKVFFKKNKNLAFLIPFLILSILFVGIPLVMIIIQSVTPTETTTVTDNWNIIDSHIAQRIGVTLGVSLAVLAICVPVGYLFAYFLSLGKSKTVKLMTISLIVSPIWLSILVKVVGLKTIFDFMNGGPNSSFGHIYTILTASYLALPLFIITVYNFLNSVPKNLTDASKDLGKSSIQTFFFVVVPYTKSAIIAGSVLVFLNAFTTAGVDSFVNNSNDSNLIGSDLLQQGQLAIVSQLELSRISSISLLLSLIILLAYLFTFFTKKFYKKYKTNVGGNDNVIKN